MKTKKRLVSLLLAATVLLSSASAAFTDISDSKVKQTATVLSALGIMQGVGGTHFSPDTALTRAQFCKIAVTALGVTDVTAYRSYTIFPDVKNSHWAAPYVNAAMRHPDIKKQSIIRGYADGTFGPDKTVNYGEACTMLLRMLGYTESDIGPFWPADYIARADSLGLTNGVTDVKPTEPLKRGAASIMLLNTLAAKPKEGETLLKRIASSTIENSILLATSETNSKLRTGEALFYEGGDVIVRATTALLDKSMVGVNGTVILDKDNTNTVLGIVPNRNKVEMVTVRGTAADGISTDSGMIKPDRNLPLYTGELTTPKKFSEAWADISIGSTLYLFYDQYGQLALLAAIDGRAAVSGTASTFVYGLPTSANISTGFTIVKNGVTISRDQLKKYDVVTLDPANKKALVSDARLAGQYRAGEPSFTYPQTVTLYDDTYSISDKAAASFAGLKLGEDITLLFDALGNVAAAYPRATVSASNEGVVTGIKDGKVTVEMLSGLTVHATASMADASTVMGRLVTVGAGLSGRATLSAQSLSSRVAGNWAILNGTIGTTPVSPNVRVYEEVMDKAPINKIAVSRIETEMVSNKDIRYTLQDNSGTVIAIVLGDVTGESWLYGFSTGGSTAGEEGFSVGLMYWNGTAGETAIFPAKSTPDKVSNSLIAVPKGYSTSTQQEEVLFKQLKLVGSVDLSAFDSNNGVRTTDGYYQIGENAGVYVSGQETMISLSNAKINYKKFNLYANTGAVNGEKIRVIVAS